MYSQFMMHGQENIKLVESCEESENFADIAVV